MRQLQYTGPREVTWFDVPEPTIQADHEALVATVAATTCDVDAVVIAGSSPFAPPFPIGHEAVGRVVDLGDAVTGLGVGDLVAVPYHRSCGRCGPCGRDALLHCEPCSVSGIPASYGFPHAGAWGGMFSELFRVPFAAHALVPLPATIDPIAAVSVGDNLTDAWSTTVPHLREIPHARTLIMSGGGYGLYATQWALASGASDVVYVDDSEARRRLAASLGAEPLDWREDLRLDRQFDVLVNARPEPASLRTALRAAAPNARCESTAIFFDEVALPLPAMHAAGVRLRSSFAATRLHMVEVVNALAEGVIDPRLIESELVALDDVPERFADLSHKPIVSFEPHESSVR
jgi:alcohol dehydrogenase